MFTWCSTALGHQMPLVGVHLTKHQPDQQADHLLCWPAVVWLLTTRCMYWDGALGLTGGVGGVRGHWGLHMKNYDSVFQSTLEKSRQYIADNRTWVQVNQASVSTTLGHQMHLLWGWVHLTTYHSDPQADDMSCWPAVVPLMITRCLYLKWGHQGGLQVELGVWGGIGGYIWNMKMGYCKVLLKTQDSLLQTIEHDLNATGAKLVPFLVTRLLYQKGVTSELRSVVCTLVPLFSQVSSIYTITILCSAQLYIQ